MKPGKQKGKSQYRSIDTHKTYNIGKKRKKSDLTKTKFNIKIVEIKL